MPSIDYLNNTNSKSSKKIFLIVGITILVVIIDIIFIWFFFGRDNSEFQNPPVEQNQIQKSNLLDSEQININNIAFDIPGGYESINIDGIYTITKKENDNNESIITINTINSDENINFEDFVAGEIINLTDIVEKDITNGKKVFGISKNISKLITFIKTDKGLVIIESTGDKINEAVFDAVASSVRTN